MKTYARYSIFSRVPFCFRSFVPLERCGENKLFLHSSHVANIPYVYFYIAHTFKMCLTFWPVISPTYGSQLPIKIDLILPSFQILDWDCKQHIFLSFRFLCALWFSSTPLECFSTGLRLMTSTFSIENSPLWIIVFFSQVFLHRSTCWQNYIHWLIMNNSSTFQKYPFQQIINLIAPHLLADEDSDQLMASHNQVC